MSFVNYSLREINCKIVYYGPGLCGKTTNLQCLYERTAESHKGKLISLATETERTLFFDFLPLSLGDVHGFRTRFHLYTVPGQVFYDASRKLILQDADGVVFVADSDPDRMDANLESMADLADHLAEQQRSIDTVPLVLQYNKRDMPGASSLADLQTALNPKGRTHQEAVAKDGIGVFDTLKAISRLVLLAVRETTLAAAVAPTEQAQRAQGPGQNERP